MMPLLERQVRLVAYMTSSAAIFGGGGSLPPELEGIGRALLRVEAQFSYAKRMEKISAVLPRTFELLGSNEAAVVREFVETCPPTSLSRLENARQFHGFLASRWKREAPDPPYICDVAACEISCAEVDAAPQDRQPDRMASADHRSGMRRSQNIVLLRCAYDIRPIFETGPKKAAPVKRDTPLVIALPPDADGPQVFEVVPAIFDLLSALDNWSDPREWEAGRELGPLLADLMACGFIEAHR
jgi:hypothetical protein